MAYRYPAINLPALLNTWTDREWLVFLAKCEREQDIEKLKSTMYGICRGMAEVAKVNLNDEKMDVAFTNLTRSIEVTLKRILRKKYPSIFDKNPKANLREVDGRRLRKELTNKRRRDEEFTKFLSEARP